MSQNLKALQVQDPYPVNYNRCGYCGNLIFDMDIVRYWNTERQEIYCGGECSLNRHEEFRLFVTPKEKGLYAKLT